MGKPADSPGMIKASRRTPFHLVTLSSLTAPPPTTPRCRRIQRPVLTAQRLGPIFLSGVHLITHEAQRQPAAASSRCLANVTF